MIDVQKNSLKTDVFVVREFGKNSRFNKSIKQMMMNDIGTGIFFQNVYYENKIQTYYILQYWNSFISNSYLQVILY